MQEGKIKYIALKYGIPEDRVRAIAKRSKNENEFYDLIEEDSIRD